MLIVERGYFRVVMAHDTDGKIPLLVQINLDMTGDMDLRGARRCFLYKRDLFAGKTCAFTSRPLPEEQM